MPTTNAGLEDFTKRIAEIEAELDTRVIRDGFTRGDLREAFSHVRPAENWKFAIDATIPESEIAILKIAIPFFTGSKPTFRRIGKTSAFVVRAAGYYSAVGA